MSIYHMTREQLIAKAERDDASVLRAAATLKDNMDLQEKVANLRRKLAERDDASVLRAAATLKDNMDLQEKVANLRRELAEERAKPPPEAQVPRLVRTVTVTVPGPERVMERTVNVPTPCPKQAAEIKRLNAQLAKFKKYDIAEFEQWRRMVEAAKR